MSRLRSPRVQVSIALFVAAAARAASASKSSSDELEGPYRDSARAPVTAATGTLEANLASDGGGRPAQLRGSCACAASCAASTVASCR